MNGKRFSSAGLVLITVAMLFSCGAQTSLSSSLSPAVNSSASSDDLSSAVTEAYAVKEDIGNYSLNKLRHLAALPNENLNSIGTKKLLVIPVTFQNCDAFTADQLDVIDKAFNGAKSEVGWESLKSFYQTSSYGKLTIEGVVTKPYTVPMDDYERDPSIIDTINDKTFEGQVYSGAYSVSRLVNEAVSALGTSYSLSDFDLDKDGFIDGVEIVYIGGREWVNGTDDPSAVWWNYTDVANNYGSQNNTIPGIFFFSQLSLIQDGYYDINIDAHTAVHETGHMLGLEDYYCYDTLDDGYNKENPAGMVDMMDRNIVDHNAFSKMLLGWIKPKYVTGKVSDFDISLNSFTETGDCLLLRNCSLDPWNGTSYDEYLLLQYYTISGLNEQDALQGYKDWGNYCAYKKAGLQVFHIDSRLFNGKTDDPSKWAYTDDTSSGSLIAASNTPSYSVNIKESQKTGVETMESPYRLIEAIPATGVDYFGHASYHHFGDQQVLFGLSSYGCGGTEFSMEKMKNVFPNGTLFNDGSQLEYSFTVTAQTDENITLHFSRA